MAGLKPFRTIPKDIVEWTKWMREQVQPIQDVIDDGRVKGSTSFPGVDEVIVSVSETSANYTVFIEPSINETFWVTNKKTTSFMLHSSNSTSTATVKWILTR